MDNKKIYLDKIVNYIVDDTIINYNTDIIIFPFSIIGPLGRPLPSFISDGLDLMSFYSFYKYCKDTYGLTDEETDYVWNRYKVIINNKIKGNINESVDRRSVYLDKIVDFLVDDTKMDYNTHKVWYPFMSDDINPFPFSPNTIFNIEVSPVFVDYLNTMYGIDWYDSDYVWKKYTTIMMNKYKNDIINESVDRKNDYLDKIVEFLVTDTDIEYGKKMIRYPFLPSTLFSVFSSFRTPYVKETPFSKYIKDNYGLTDGEIDYVWEEYKNIILDKFNNMGSINESVDRKQDYLDKIVDFLVEDTDIGLGWFSPPYYYPGSTAGRTNFRSVYEHTFNLSSNTNYSGLDTQLIYFDHYCKNNYGLTGQENKIVWERYMKKLKETYKWGF